MIEDNRDSIEGIIDYCNDKEYEVRHVGFEDGLAQIESFDPDIVIADLQDPHGEYGGCKIIDNIWNKRFRPICIFSGMLEESAIETEKYKSPLIRFIKKGKEAPVKKYIEEVAKHAGLIRSIQDRTHEAMRKAFDVIEFTDEDNITDEAIITYLCHSRIREYFSKETEEKSYPVWSQYVYPVLSELFSTGDIVCSNEYQDAVAKGNKHYIILSQSCDLAQNKISNVLVAKCHGIDRYVVKSFKKPKELKEKSVLKSELNMGYSFNLFPLPELKGVIPDMVVDLRDLEIIKYEDLKTKYIKKVSLSSPYKERLVWAYMQSACRPGVPNLLVDQWIDRIYPKENSENDSN